MCPPPLPFNDLPRPLHASTCESDLSTCESDELICESHVFACKTLVTDMY